MTRTTVVTRHGGLVEYLVEEGIVEAGVDVLAHATPENVEGRHVVGVLPLHLAACAETLTEIPLRLPPELRGTELTVEQVRAFAGPAVTYSVTREETEDRS